MKLKCSLTTFDIFCIASGVMISSGIFILPGLAFSRTGPSVFISYFIAGLAALIGVLSIIELSTAMPKAGGDYYFITRSFGPLVGIISGFFSWFALSFKAAFAIFGIAELLYSITGGPLILFGILVTLFFIVLNILGIDIAAKFQTFIVMGLLAIMIIYILTGISGIDLDRFKNFTPRGMNSIFFTAGFVFVSFGGLLKVASLSGEVKKPKISIPVGIISSTVIVTIIYSFLLIVLVGNSVPEQLIKSLTPVADSAKSFLGNPGFLLVTVAALLAFISTANAGILAASRYPIALSNDSLVPDFLSYIYPKFKTPITAIIITGIVIVSSLFLKLEYLVKIASSIIIFSYLLSNLAVIVIRESKIQNYSPSFKVPFYPWIQIFSIILFVILLVEVGLAAIEVILVIIILSLIVYILYGRKKYQQEFAMLYLLERIINKKLTSYNLEQELKEILHNRDSIIVDRFHKLIDESTVMDLNKKMDWKELFRLVSQQCSDNLQIEPDELLTLLNEREEESSTAITKFLAIPHIIVDKQNLFKILIIRNKQGVKFSECYDSVKAIFVLFGSRDQRQFHLQALSAIAQIAQNKDFEKKWMEAKGAENVRDICLLSKRKREE